MDTLWQDTRFAIRSLLKTPSFTALAVLTLALGIGANTAIFCVVRGVVLKPLAYERPEEIVRVWPQRNLSKEMLAGFAKTESFSATSGYHGALLTLTEAGEPAELSGLAVTPGHFEVLAARPLLGRVFEVADREPGAVPVVVLSHGLWQRQFGADPGIVGADITLSGLGAGERRVVGVMPADFQPVVGRAVELWAPLTVDESNLDDYRDMLALRVMARLAPGISPDMAEAEVRTIAARLQAELPDYHTDEQVRTAGVVPLHEILTGGVRATLWILLGAVGCVLLIGCSNLANMLLARTGARRQEIAVRRALGSGQTRLMRLLLTESVLLGLLGGATGLLAATWLESFLVHSLPASVPRSQEIGIGSAELAFATALSLLAALGFGFIPAWRATRAGNRSSLRGGDRRLTDGRKSHRLNQGLVVAEVAVSVILVAGAGLMLKSLWRLQQVDPGFQAENLLVLRLSPQAERYPESASLGGYYRDVLARVESLPGVVSAGAINLLPMTSANLGMGYSTTDEPDKPRMVSVRAVTPGYFESLGVPLLDGRHLTATDHEGTAEVGLINHAMAHQLWPSESAVGKAIRWDDGTPWFTVVGVVGDVHQNRLDRAPKPEVYRPFEQAFGEILSPTFYLTVRTQADAATLAPDIRSAVWAADDNVPISNVGTMRTVIENSLASSRFFALLLTAFGTLALLLGGIGIYGVGSYGVSRRTREIGVRMALGARRQTMLRSVMVRELTPIVLGLALGLVGAIAGARVLASSLFEVTTTDPLTFAATTVLLGSVAILASYLPARRAAGVDPILALRSE